MNICYVCGNLLEKDAKCSVCGFDASTDYENYPTLQLAPSKTTIAQIQNDRIVSVVKAVIEYNKSVEEQKMRSVIETTLEENSKRIKDMQSGFENLLRQYSGDVEKRVKTTLDAAISEQNKLILKMFADSAELIAKTPVSGADESQKIINPAFEKVSSLKVGDYISLGHSNGKEIIWEVLESVGSRALIISRDIIDVKYCSKYPGAPLWNVDEVRQWLNFYFFIQEDYLDKRESRLFENTTITYAGDKMTTDSVFLLSDKDVMKYMPSEKRRKANVIDENKACAWWWLREGMAVSNSDGKIISKKAEANKAGGVRPAAWINLNKSLA